METSTSWIVVLFRTFVILLIPLAFIFIQGKKKLRFNALVEKLPGPNALPLIGNALLMTSLDLSEMFYYICVTSVKEYGRLFRYWVLSTPQIMIANAKDAEKLLQGMQHHAKSLNYRFLDSWMGEGLLTSKDDKWRVHRKILTPAFHFNILHEFLPILNRNSKILTEKLAGTEEVKNGQDLNIFEHVSLCALDIICESSMGTIINAQIKSDSPYVQAVNKLNVLLPERYFSPTHRFDWFFKYTSLKKELDKQLKISDEFTDKVINERREYLKTLKQPKSLDEKDEFGKRKNQAFLDMLLNAQDNGEQFMTQKDIRDQVSTFMFEGHDTVTTATCWALFMIGTHPEIQKLVVEELNQVFGSSGKEPDMNDLAELKLLERCIKESMRLYPSVPFFERYLREDCKLEDGSIIPAGCNVSIVPYAIHRDPEYFPNPERFDPDRFLPDNTKGRHPYAYLPFSAGPRNCIGQKFALMEEKVVISTVLRRFRVEAAHKPEEAGLQIGLVLRPKHGLKVRLFERKDYPNLKLALKICM